MAGRSCSPIATAAEPTMRWALRTTGTGAADTSFFGDGLAIINTASGLLVEDAVLQGDQPMFLQNALAGGTRLLRMTSTGAPDTTLGPGGVLATNYVPAYQSAAPGTSPDQQRRGARLDGRARDARPVPGCRHRAGEGPDVGSPGNGPGGSNRRVRHRGRHHHDGDLERARQQRRLGDHRLHGHGVSGGATFTDSMPPLSCTVTGLTNGQAYTFVVTATNAIGTSAPSSPSNSVTPAAPNRARSRPCRRRADGRLVGHGRRHRRRATGALRCPQRRHHPSHPHRRTPRHPHRRRQRHPLRRRRRPHRRRLPHHLALRPTQALHQQPQLHQGRHPRQHRPHQARRRRHQRRQGLRLHQHQDRPHHRHHRHPRSASLRPSRRRSGWPTRGPRSATPTTSNRSASVPQRRHHHRVTVAGRGGIPTDAAPPSSTSPPRRHANGYLTVWPCGQPTPRLQPQLTGAPSPTPSSPDRHRAARSASTPVAPTHLVTDTTGWFPTGPFSARPRRAVLDTRGHGATPSTTNTGAGLVAAGTTIELPVAGRGGIPADADAAVLNVTATGANANGYLTVWPCGQPDPSPPASTHGRHPRQHRPHPARRRRHQRRQGLRLHQHQDRPHHRHGRFDLSEGAGAQWRLGSVRLERP